MALGYLRSVGRPRRLDDGAPAERSMAHSAPIGRSRSVPGHQRAGAPLSRDLTSAFAKLASIDVDATALTTSSTSQRGPAQGVFALRLAQQGRVIGVDRYRNAAPQPFDGCSSIER
jgi:hypothetical protein